MKASLLGGVFAISAVAFCIMFLATITVCIIWSSAKYKELERLGSKHPWMAWIPILSFIMLARKADRDTGHNMDIFTTDAPVNVFITTL